MNGREIIRDIMTRLKITNAALANKLGITPAALWDRIDTQPRKGKPRKDIPVSLLSNMVQAMGYKVLIVPVDTMVPEDGYAIEDKENYTESTKPKIDLDVLLTDDEPVTQSGKSGKRIKLL